MQLTSIPDPPAPTAPATPRRRRIRATGLSVCMCALALLIWAKLRLVASIPRSVIAVPKQVTPPDRP